MRQIFEESSEGELVRVRRVMITMKNYCDTNTHLNSVVLLTHQRLCWGCFFYLQRHNILHNCTLLDMHLLVHQ